MVQYRFTSTETQKFSIGRTAQDGHLDSHTAPELCDSVSIQTIVVLFVLVQILLAAINDPPCFIWVVCNKLTTVWAPTETAQSLADSFLDAMA